MINSLPRDVINWAEMKWHLIQQRTLIAFVTRLRMNQVRTDALHSLSVPGVGKDEMQGPGAEKTPFSKE
jgi:hypothetical protein